MLFCNIYSSLSKITDTLPRFMMIMFFLCNLSKIVKVISQLMEEIAY